MLLIWCKEIQLIQVISGKSNANIVQTVIIQRQSGSFGFRLHGCRPILVSAIEPETPSENSALEVGHVILTINGVNVLELDHSDVIEIVKSSRDSLTLEVLKTCTAVNPIQNKLLGEPICCGYLWKLSGYASGLPSNKWLRRWFTLRDDNCLYFYKVDGDTHPIGAIMLLNYKVVRIWNESTETFRFDIQKTNFPTLHLAADTEDGVNKWLSALQKIIDKCENIDARLEKRNQNKMLSPSAISTPDCFGYLTQFQFNSYTRRYCILKDACLYLYEDVNSKNALEVTCLYEYKVQKSIEEYAFDVIPENLKHKVFRFLTESDLDRERWIFSLERSCIRKHDNLEVAKF
ncbi:hypothetical protein FQR65_LT12052 [Abscondita terminalis]|nr:hypothetical protein FQR65_LT12052 [Abscondita terminalis]